MDKQLLKIAISHPDPKIEKEGVRAFKKYLKAISKITGEEIKILKVSHLKKEEDNE